MSDLEEIRKKRVQELLAQQLQQQAQQQLQNQIQEEQVEAQIKKIMHLILTPQARERLGNIKVVRPQVARSVEILLIQLYQTGRIPKPLSDSEFKELLVKLKEGRKEETKIKRR